MQNIKTLIDSVKSGAQDGKLRTFYALDGSEESLSFARARILHVIEGFRETFDAAEDTEVILVSGPGRTEIGGNHTDHQHGHVLCASVDMDVLGCAALNDRGIIRLMSEGYGLNCVELDSLLPREDEQGSSQGLVRGVAVKIAELGYTLRGVDIYTVSSVISGSGLSSSAAFETLVGNVLNCFCAGGELDAVTIAKIGQYAENIYFGKPCGLMDQMGSSIGGAVAIDFAEPASPVIRRVSYDFSKSGHALCILDTGSTHADLTDSYADITREMGAVAAFFGKTYLREISEADFRTEIPAVRSSCGDRAMLRALHYFEDDRRAVREAEALEKGDFAEFLHLVNESGRSSALNLQNTYSLGTPQNQAIPVALALGEELLGGEGAIRVHGGGFAGTIQAWVPNEKLYAFKSGMEAVFGAGKCHILRVRPNGGCVITD